MVLEEYGVPGVLVSAEGNRGREGQTAQHEEGQESTRYADGEEIHGNCPPRRVSMKTLAMREKREHIRFKSLAQKHTQLLHIGQGSSWLSHDCYELLYTLTV